MRRAGAVVLVVAVVATAVLAGMLLERERGGPRHYDVTLPGDVPATFYPGRTAGAPAVVVGHGYSGDRATMSSLARSIASAGYAVLAIDFGGHGANPNGFDEGGRVDDLDAALDWLENSPEVDGDALALLGHSMGGHAVLDVARTDPRVDVAVVLGATGLGNDDTLFLFGETEAELVEEVDYAVTGVVEGANHITILWFDETVRQILGWLDGSFGVGRGEFPGIVDPRLDLALPYLLCAVVVFAGLGAVAGRVGPRVPPGAPAGPRTAALIAVALVAGIPIAWLLEPASFLGEGWGGVVSYFVVAGAVLFLPQIRRRPKPARPNAALARLAAAGALSLAGAFVLLAPLGGLAHRLVPNVQRAVLAAVMVPLLALFFVQLQALLRRGPLRRATACSVAGHGAILAALLGGVVTGAFPGVVALALPLIAGVFALVEVFGAAAYTIGRNGALVGVVEALWVAGIAAIAMPLPG